MREAMIWERAATAAGGHLAAWLGREMVSGGAGYGGETICIGRGQSLAVVSERVAA
jgi:acetyl-CoA acetyltransferase